ncbi:family 1 glycosylhydrolase [Neobacillus drentensis]
MDFYKGLVNELLENGITPNATLYHWDLPQVLENKGGWTNRDVKDWFGEYASLMFREFNGLVPMWSTLNEPIAIYAGYGLGFFAPGIRDEKLGKAAKHHALLAHGEAVKAFRAEGMKDSEVGIVIDIWKRHAARDCHEDMELVKRGDENSFLFFLNPIFKGHYSDYILNQMSNEGTMPDIQLGDLELISQPIDYYGLNVYNRILVSEDPNLSTDPATAHLRNNNENGIVGGNFLDNGQEFYPKSVYDAIKLLNEDIKINIPIYITENGIYNCNEDLIDGNVHDIERIKYIEGFLHWTQKAIALGADVRGYYVWSLMDNYEWAAGYNRRYGLIHVDIETQKRIWKDSAYWYKEVIERNQVKVR